jgi:hypothetical protein
MEDYTVTTTRIRIDLTQGIIEAEGTEDFVRSIYGDYKEALKSDNRGRSGLSPEGRARKTRGPGTLTATDSGSTTKKKKGGGGRSTPAIVKDLNLAGDGKKKRLKEFYEKFTPTSNFERNLIFVYYLQHELGLTGITVDHVFTCYRDIQVRAPAALLQSLWDTSNRRGWLDTSTTEDIKVTVPGMNYLEHDMPRANK